MDTLFNIGVYLASAYVGLLALFALYLAVMGLKRVEKDLDPIVRYTAANPIIGIGLVVDVLVNICFMTFLLTDVPHLHKMELTLTARLKRLKKRKKNSYRKRIALWACPILSKIDPDNYHC